jgi:hypothetical protein
MTLQQDPEFVQNLKEYLSLEKKIVDFKGALKRLETRKKELYNKVHQKMIIKKVETLKLPNGAKLKNYVRKSKEGLTKAYVQNRLKMYCDQNQLNFDEVNDFLYNNKYRKVTEVPAIKKTNPRKKK